MALPSISVGCSSKNNISVPNWKKAAVTHSQGGNALSVSGKVPVSIKAIKTKLLLTEPSSQEDVTQIFQELLQSNSTIIAKTYGGTSIILTHGIGLDKSYWDISRGYSYVDAAATEGFASLAYKRLGVGSSDHPDPIQIVQASVDVEIQHGLTSLI